MFSYQLAHCLRDPDILRMVGQGQLKLVLNHNFPEPFTFCSPGGASDGLFRDKALTEAADHSSLTSAKEQVGSHMPVTAVTA